MGASQQVFHLWQWCGKLISTKILLSGLLSATDFTGSLVRLHLECWRCCLLSPTQSTANAWAYSVTLPTWISALQPTMHSTVPWLVEWSSTRPPAGRGLQVVPAARGLNKSATVQHRQFTTNGPTPQLGVMRRDWRYGSLLPKRSERRKDFWDIDHLKQVLLQCWVRQARTQ